MQKLSIVLLTSATLVATSGCATKKFVRSSVQTSSDALSARIDTNEGEMREIRDNLDRKVSGVDSRVTALDTKTTAGLEAVRTDVRGVDQKAGDARAAADKAGTSADRANSAVSTLGDKFTNRNQYNVTDEKTVQFKFDSAKLDQTYMDMLDQIASTLVSNPNAIVVLEGRTDSTGDKDYNVRLGERRVDAVRQYLAVDKSVPVYKIHEVSFGAAKPIAENNTKDGREKNRAVTITVLVPKVDGEVAARN
jgi:outer membrane protein OmpA-like peptidoglycan-associated protein